MSNARNGVKFTSENAAEMGRRSAEARRARKAMQDATERAAAKDVQRHVSTLIESFRRDELGPMAAAVAIELIGRVSRGEIPVRHAGDAAELVRVLVDVARLEAGESTSNAVVAHVSTDQAVARVVELQQRARAALTSSPAVVDAAALAADDAHGSEGDDAVVVVADHPSPRTGGV